jgi:hypothetical protein
VICKDKLQAAQREPSSILLHKGLQNVLESAHHQHVTTEAHGPTEKVKGKTKTEDLRLTIWWALKLHIKIVYIVIHQLDFILTLYPG